MWRKMFPFVARERDRSPMLRNLSALVFALMVIVVLGWTLHDGVRGWGGGFRHGTLLVAEADKVVLSRTTARQGKVSGVARVRNQGAASVRILRTVSSCPCLVAANVADVVVPPGATLSIPFSVGVPQSGSLNQQLSIHSDTKQPPVVVNIHIEDSTTVPRILIVINKQPHFMRESQELVCTVITAESHGSSAWLEEFITTGRGFSVTGVTVLRVQEHDDYLERRYDVTVKWDSSSGAAVGTEYYGGLRASSSEGHETRNISGLVACIASPISPSVVVLDRVRRYDFVFFDNDDATADDWQLTNAVDLPSWLKIVWDRSGDQPCLRVEWPGKVDDPQPEKLEVRLEGRDGRQMTVPVVIIASG